MRRYTIGRHESSDIVVANATVSRQHAELADLGNGAFKLSDLKSTSGTHAFLDGQWVEASGIEVTADTKVGIGEHETTVRELLKLAGVEIEEATRAPALARAQPAPAVAAARAPAIAADTDPAPPPEPAVMAPAPKAAKPPKPPKPPKAAAPAGQGNKTMWLVIGGVALFVLVGVAAVATILISGGGTSTSTSTSTSSSSAPARSDQGRLVAACEKGRSANRRLCECLAKIVLAEFSGKDRELLIRIFEEGASGDPAKIAQTIQDQRDVNPVDFGRKFAAVMPRVQRECS
jgi:hypothetical protein